MADETQQGTGNSAGGDTGAEKPVSSEDLDALFDQVATADPSATSADSPESGTPAAAVEGEDGAGKIEGQDKTEGTPAADSSTSLSGSKASGAAPAASAPDANDDARPAAEKTAAPASEGKPAPAQGKAGKLSPEEENRRLKGRIAALTRDNDALKRNGTLTPAATSSSAPANGGPDKTGNGGGPPKSKVLAELEKNPAWQTVKKDYAEIAGPIEQALGAMAAEVEPLTAGRQRDALDKNGEIVATAHPDAGKIVSSKEFTDWFNTQPAYVRNTIIANGNGVRDPDACIDVFNRFKADTGYTSQAPSADGKPAAAKPTDEATLAARAARKDGAIGGVNHGKGGSKTALPEDPDALFDALATQADKARAGRKAA